MDNDREIFDGDIEAQVQYDLEHGFTIRNSNLHNAILSTHRSISAFCRAHPALRGSVSHVCALVSLSYSPFKQDGTYREMCSHLEQATGLAKEHLFPFELYEQVGASVSLVVEEVDDVEKIPAPPNRDYADRISGTRKSKTFVEHINATVKTLEIIEGIVIRLRYGFDGKGERTLDEVGEIIGESRYTARQIEARAMRKLQQPSRSGPLAKYITGEFGDDELREISDDSE